MVSLLSFTFVLLMAIQATDGFDHAPPPPQHRRYLLEGGGSSHHPLFSTPVVHGFLPNRHEHDQHERSLQSSLSCEAQLETALSQSFGGTYTTECTCANTNGNAPPTSATCTYTVPLSCDTVDCTSSFECVDPAATTVNYCVQIQAMSDIVIEVMTAASGTDNGSGNGGGVENDVDDQARFRETSRTVTRFFPNGVSNVCTAVDVVFFDSPTDTAATSCTVEFDSVPCKDCSICDSNAASATRSIDCSNVDPDAVDTDCVPETDFVDAQVLKFDESSTCQSTSPTAASAPADPDGDGTLVSTTTSAAAADYSRITLLGVSAALGVATAMAPWL